MASFLGLYFLGDGLVEVIKTTSMFLLLSCVYAVIDISVKVASLLLQSARAWIMGFFTVSRFFMVSQNRLTQGYPSEAAQKRTSPGPHGAAQMTLSHGPQGT